MAGGDGRTRPLIRKDQSRGARRRGARRQTQFDGGLEIADRRDWGAYSRPHPDRPTAPCDAGLWRARRASDPQRAIASAPRSAARRRGPAPRPPCDWERHRDRATPEAARRAAPRAPMRRSAAGRSVRAPRRRFDRRSPAVAMASSRAPRIAPSVRNRASIEPRPRPCAGGAVGKRSSPVDQAAISSSLATMSRADPPRSSRPMAPRVRRRSRCCASPPRRHRRPAVADRPICDSAFSAWKAGRPRPGFRRKDRSTRRRTGATGPSTRAARRAAD